MKLLLILILSLVTTGQTLNCAKENSSDQEFMLKYGQTIDYKEENLKIKFVSVPEDSRCPQGEQCIRAGNAGIMLELTKENNKPSNIILNTASEPQEYVYQGLEIKLVDLTPFPKSNVKLKTADYVVTLKIYKQKE